MAIYDEELEQVQAVGDVQRLADGIAYLRDMQQLVSGQFGNEALTPSKDNVRSHFLALADEVFELLHEFSWKPWKSKDEPLNREAAIEEFADILAFLGVIINYMETLSGVTPDELALAYREKSAKNIARFLGKVAGYERKDWNVSRE